MSELKRVSRLSRRWLDISVLVLGRLSAVLATVVSVRLMTTLLTQQEVGRYSVILALTQGFSLTLVSPAGNYFNRQFVRWTALDVLWEACRRYSWLLLLITLLSILAAVLIGKTGLIGISINGIYLALCVAGMLLFLTANTMLINFLNVLGHRALYVLYASSTLWLGVGISALYTLAIHRSAEFWIAGQISGWAIVSVVAYVSLRRIVSAGVTLPEVEAADEQGLWVFAWPLVVSTSLYWFQVQGYRILLDHWVDVAALGLLTTGLTLGANPIAIIDTLLGEYLRPAYYKAIATEDRIQQERAWSEMAGTFLAVLLPIAALVGLSGPFLTILLAGPAFQAAAGFVFWGVLIEYLRAANSLYVLASHAALRTRSTIRPGLFGACIVGVAIGPLARWNLINGSGLALAGGMLGATAYLAYELRPHFATRLPARPLATSLVATSPVVVVMLGARLLIPHPSLLEAFLVLCCGSILMLGILIFIIQDVRAMPYSLATIPKVRT